MGSTHKGRTVPKGKTRIGAVLVCMAILAASGCTQNSDGTPSPASNTPSTGDAPTSMANDTNTAPVVANPLDVSKFMTSPCLSMTSAQATELTVSPQGRPENRDSPACTWRYGPNLEWNVSVGYVVPDAKNGLQNLYHQNAAGWFSKGYFEPTRIDDYPAVYNSDSDDRAKGQCELSVGVNEQTMITVLNNGENNTDLCRGAAKVANAVVETIKRG